MRCLAPRCPDTSSSSASINSSSSSSISLRLCVSAKSRGSSPCLALRGPLQRRHSVRAALAHEHRRRRRGRCGEVREAVVGSGVAEDWEVAAEAEHPAEHGAPPALRRGLGHRKPRALREPAEDNAARRRAARFLRGEQRARPRHRLADPAALPGDLPGLGRGGGAGEGFRACLLHARFKPRRDAFFLPRDQEAAARGAGEEHLAAARDPPHEQLHQLLPVRSLVPEAVQEDQRALALLRAARP
eukprot:3228041-Rhodomonas_salina.1